MLLKLTPGFGGRCAGAAVMKFFKGFLSVTDTGAK
jgi:hypothetical protein